MYRLSAQILEIVRKFMNFNSFFTSSFQQKYFHGAVSMKVTRKRIIFANKLLLQHKGI